MESPNYRKEFIRLPKKDGWNKPFKPRILEPLPLGEIQAWRSAKIAPQQALPQLVRHGAIDLVRKTLAEGNVPPLLLYGSVVEACLRGDLDVLRLLIDHGAPVDLNWIDGDDCFEPLMIACILNRLGMAQTLLHAGSRTDSCNHSEEGVIANPIHYAVAWGNVRMIELLASFGALDAPVVGHGPIVGCNPVAGCNLLEVADFFGHTDVKACLRAFRVTEADPTNDGLLPFDKERTLRELHRRVVLWDFRGIGCQIPLTDPENDTDRPEFLGS